MTSKHYYIIIKYKKGIINWDLFKDYLSEIIVRYEYFQNNNKYFSQIV